MVVQTTGKRRKKSSNDDKSRSAPHEDDQTCSDAGNQEVLDNESNDQNLNFEDNVAETQETTNVSYVSRLEERVANQEDEINKLKDILEQKDKEIFELKKKITTADDASESANLEMNDFAENISIPPETSYTENVGMSAANKLHSHIDEETSDAEKECDIENVDKTDKVQRQRGENIAIESPEEQQQMEESVDTVEVQPQEEQNNGDKSGEWITENDDHHDNGGQQLCPRRSGRIPAAKLQNLEAMILKEKLEIVEDSKHGLKIDPKIIDRNGFDKGRGIRVRNICLILLVSNFISGH